jgi:hypothetical protein
MCDHSCEYCKVNFTDAKFVTFGSGRNRIDLCKDCSKIHKKNLQKKQTCSFCGVNIGNGSKTIADKIACYNCVIKSTAAKKKNDKALDEKKKLLLKLQALQEDIDSYHNSDACIIMNDSPVVEKIVEIPVVEKAPEKIIEIPVVEKIVEIPVIEKAPEKIVEIPVVEKKTFKIKVIR